MATVTVLEPRETSLYRGTKVVWYILNVLEVILLFRFVLRLLGANSGATFTDIVYSISYPFVAPFMNVFSVTRVAGATFEWTTLLAMLVYYLIAWGIVRLMLMGRPVSTPEAHNRLVDQDVR